MYSKKIIGKKCYLSPVCIEDAPTYFKWKSEAETSIYLLSFSHILTLQQEQDYLLSAVRGLPYQQIFSIINIFDNKLVGNCSLHQIDMINRSAEFVIYIGEKEVRGHGIGTEAALLALDYAFGMLNLHSVWLRVFEFNKRGHKLFKKIGFKDVGRMREARLIGKNKYDVLYMDILESEYKSIYIDGLLKSLSSV